MALFKKKPSPTTWWISVPHSESFRGFERIKLATYNDKDAETGIKKVLKRPTRNEVRFEEIPQHNGIIVYVDGNKVGLIWKDSWTDLYKRIRSGKVSEASFQYNGDAYIYIK